MNASKNKFHAVMAKDTKSIDEQEAILLEDDCIEEIDAIIRKAKGEIKAAKRTLLRAENPKNIKTAPKTWVQEIVAAERKLRVSKVDLEIAEDIKKSWFGEEPQSNE